jgi:hypothetical protein
MGLESLPEKVIKDVQDQVHEAIEDFKHTP